MSSLAAWSALAGMALGIGLWSLASLTPRLSRPSLAQRTAPYLVDVSAGAREFVARRASDPVPVLGLMLGPAVGIGTRALAAVLGGGESIERRLVQSRSTLSVDGFRSQQLLGAVTGAFLGIVVIVGFSQFGVVPPATQVAFSLLLGATGIAARDAMLRRAARRRLARIESELPTVLEFLTLSLSAGETVLDGLRRIARISGGELAREFAIVVTEVNSGTSIASALGSRASALQLPSFTRCVEQMTGALERGTPLSEVLRAQAQDSREDSKRALLEVAGKKEVTMLVPLVFLILPTTVLFAIWPGLFVLQTGF
jgi:tight adherence protein C